MEQNNIAQGAFFLHSKEREQAINAVHQHNELTKSKKYFTYKVNDKLRILIPEGKDVKDFVDRYLAKIEESHNKYQ